MKFVSWLKEKAAAAVSHAKAFLFAGAVGAAASLAPPAHADGVDVTAVTTALTGAGTTLGTVGAAIVGALVVAVVYKWVKGMMFG